VLLGTRERHLVRAAVVASGRAAGIGFDGPPVRNEPNSLIGFSGRRYRDPILGSAQAYQVANAKLYDAMAGSPPGWGLLRQGPVKATKPSQHLGPTYRARKTS